VGRAEAKLAIDANSPSLASIPVAWPQLPPAEAALPYLRSIDASRIYSNFGPLNGRFEARLAEHFGLAPECVVTCCNATAGLSLALQRAAERGGRYCLMPAWTFAASAHAATGAGLTPWLVDVDPDTGALTPDIARSALGQINPRDVGAVMPVAPFGLPIDQVTWDSFEAASGVRVVIDAAAGFDGLSVGRSPAVVSLHATKVLGIGEGGIVISRDAGAIGDARRRSNFGFNHGRDAGLNGGNAKLSEMGAAYGLAALDHWGAQRRSFEAVLSAYRTALADVPDLRLAPGLGESWVASTFNIEAPAAAVLEIERRMKGAGIATRRWWGAGLHRHRIFRDLPRGDLSVSDRLAARTLGLPCWSGLPPESIDEVAAIVREVLGG
jgi:dTDP-4-amino-4,6-dideoxygalactose transaminase